MFPIRQIHRLWVRAAWVGLFGVAAFAATRVEADAPAGRYVVANGTVRDTQTRLIWQLAVDPGTYSWSGATLYCMSLTLDGVGGFRVPSARELQTIIEEGKAPPLIDTTAFSGTPATAFWSSSTRRDMQNAAWLVSFDNGDVQSNGVSTLARVRCVR